MDTPYRILLAEGHKQLRQVLIKIIADSQGTTTVEAVGSGPEVFESLIKSAPDLLLLDICLPQLRTLEATRKIRARYPRLTILILTADRDPEYQVQATAAGATGCLIKQDADLELPRAINALRRGEAFRSSPPAATVGDKTPAPVPSYPRL